MTSLSFCGNGVMVDLLAPKPADIDFALMARRLSRINRFSGDGISVAQHCVMGCKALLRETNNTSHAALYLLHDGHEFVLGDETAPVRDARREQTALDKWQPETTPPADPVATLKAKWDDAIYEAAGMPRPGDWRPAWKKAVHDMDQRMCAAEALALYGPKSRKYFAEKYHKMPQLVGGLDPWPPMKAEEQFLATLSLYITPERIARSRKDRP